MRARVTAGGERRARAGRAGGASGTRAQATAAPRGARQVRAYGGEVQRPQPYRTGAGQHAAPPHRVRPGGGAAGEQAGVEFAGEGVQRGRARGRREFVEAVEHGQDRTGVQRLPGGRTAGLRRGGR
ncbi:hypothetical protein AB0E75_24815 [Streptomyces griseoviridis]|uniref:hypothetical protein n=1 Tax=Streptomyces griseoviridis TaxID=45398 RepID=UPI001679403A|nr:hypothetical protein [Streptomyces niveoruber]